MRMQSAPTLDASSPDRGTLIANVRPMTVWPDGSPRVRAKAVAGRTQDKSKIRRRQSMAWIVAHLLSHFGFAARLLKMGDHSLREHLYSSSYSTSSKSGPASIRRVRYTWRIVEFKVRLIFRLST